MTTWLYLIDGHKYLIQEPVSEVTLKINRAHVDNLAAVDLLGRDNKLQGYMLSQIVRWV